MVSTANLNLEGWGSQPGLADLCPEWPEPPWWSHNVGFNVLHFDVIAVNPNKLYLYIQYIVYGM